MKSYKLGHFYGKNYELIPVKRTYKSNGGLAVELVDAKTCESFAMITVNLPDFYPVTYEDMTELAFVDTNNNPWVISFLLDNGIAEYTGLTSRSGMCEYPQYRFNLSKLVDEKGLRERDA